MQNVDTPRSASDSQPSNDSAALAASQPFVGQWQRLISTTNWEKGRIISHWRQALVDAEAPNTEFSDEAWARLVGGVTGQHAGRLRRTWERFGDVFDQYEGLYWSHFQAAIEWADAEMWLEGAVQNDWSVSQMRTQRWATLGGSPASKPREEDVVASEPEEDYEPTGGGSDELRESLGVARDLTGGKSAASEVDDEGSHSRPSGESGDEAAETWDEPSGERPQPVRPFADLPSLPDDLAEAFEQFKLAILGHKSQGWKEVSRDDVLATLEALKELALAPSQAV